MYLCIYISLNKKKNILTAREGNMGNCHTKKTNATEAEPRLTLVFEDWHFPCDPLVQSIINILYWMLIKNNVYITFGIKTTGKVINSVCISYSVNSNALTMPVRIYGEPYAHKFCVIDIFWNITRRQGMSPVARFHHVLGRSFVIQRVILIFIKCLSVNQNQLIYMKV
mgnify:CR=1 FL=1